MRMTVDADVSASVAELTVKNDICHFSQNEL